MSSHRGNLHPATPAPDRRPVIVDAVNGTRTLEDLHHAASSYAADGYNVWFATNPQTGNVALWRLA